MDKKRKLYKIGDLTKLLGMTSRTIRYYHQVGILQHIKRSDGKMRLFDDEDIAIIKKVRKLQVEEGLTLEVIKERLFGTTNDKSDTVILTDSTAALPKAMRDQLNVQVIPIHIQIGEEAFLDGIDIEPKEFWEKSRNLQIRPQTSPPTEKEFVQTYLALKEKGFKRIYSIHLSSTLSETYKNALNASHKVAHEIEVVAIDSKSTGAGLGLLVHLIADAVHKGQSKEQIDLLITKQIPLIFKLVAVNTLEFLVTGGVIAPLSHNQKNLLKKLFEFKPVISLRNGTGDVEILECAKDRKDATAHMVEFLAEEIRSRGGYVKEICVIYNYMYGEALALVNQIKELYPLTPIYIEEGSAVLSAYVGPETIGIAII
ncbi:MAG: DegV family protein [Candidatus Margulisiibacteriota bacterium]